MLNRIRLAVFAVSFVTLMTELLLTRIFDYLIGPGMAYMVISSAMFSFGLAGVYGTLIRLPSKDDWGYFASIISLLAVSILLLLPVVNFLPVDPSQIGGSPRFQTVAFGLLLFAISIPFFLAGLFINTIFTVYPKNIQSLYFWDLIGAGLGCVIFLPYLPRLGPGGLLVCAAGAAMLTVALFCKRWFPSTIVCAVGAILFVIPFYRSSVYLGIHEFDRETVIRELEPGGTREFSRWDPVARIEVVDAKRDAIKRFNPPFESFKAIWYDNKRQQSSIWPFDGNFAKLRENIGTVADGHFVGVDLLAPHYLKRDTGQKVLIIGVAGGQEIKAALMYGASYVDAVEMVGTVIELGKETYAGFNGNIFNHPNVHAHVAEGRSFLRSTMTKYDIIQIQSNQTTSSIAAGQGAMDPRYLQTSDAYREYFEHLTDNGILHIKELVYPREVTTAAKAWNEIGRTDFQKHVVVLGTSEKALLKTFLVKMSPWTNAELSELRAFPFGTSSKTSENYYVIVEDPLHPEQSFLSKEFYSGKISAELASRLDYRVTPATDDRPYFHFIRKHLGKANGQFMDFGTAWILNHHVFPFVPRDIFHLMVTTAMSVIFAGLFVLVPLYFSRVGRLKWQYKASSLFYFSCLGFGFIVIELTLIQILMQFIGYPLYTYSTVLFVLLLSAGMGSHYSNVLQINPRSRWTWPFISILIFGLVLLTTYSSVTTLLLSTPIWARIVVSALMIFPLGFSLGMPFPLGILWLEKHAQGAITWAWGLNALFTVVGGLSSVILSVFLGFKITMLIALTVYLVALSVFSRLQRAEADGLRKAEVVSV
jgi:spermine/spermidine synthase